MRADSFSRNFSSTPASIIRVAPLLFLTLLLFGCKTESDSEDPIIIGVPPEDAYLGVEYAYNFGAIDKDDILNYSLTNSPTWLALEDTTNKARQGIIMRGVPGITGGQNGRDDLGKTSRINLVANDRDTLGAQPFSIDVQENVLSVESEDYSEDPVEEVEAADDERPAFRCELPSVANAGEHTYSISTYNEQGEFVGEEEKTSPTRPILIQVELDQPSVTRIDVAFEIRSNFDPTSCDKDDDNNLFPPKHQRCDTSRSNSDDAIIGRDIVALGSESGALLPVPAYVDYQQNDEGFFTKGVLTLEPGITECYVRLEVIDDLEPESEESFRFALTEVRSGIAGLGLSNSGVSEPQLIEDNEPTVSLFTTRGGKRDVLNLGSSTEYTATINGARDDTYFAKISAQAGSDAIQGVDFKLQLESAPGSDVWTDGDLIEFPVGTNDVAFRVVTADAGSYTNTSDNDRFMLLGVDDRYQAGRSNFAASIADDELRININELTTVLEVGSEDGFVPTDMALGHNGRVFVAGYDSASGNVPVVRVVDQKGNQSSDKILYPRGMSLDAPPVIATSSRDIDVVNDSGQAIVVSRYEFAVAFGVEEDAEGNPTPDNVNIVTQRWFYDTGIEPEDYAQDWELVSGSGQDDLPRWVGITPTNGSIFVSGVTKGLFEDNDTPNGRFGSFVQRIDTEQDGDLLIPKVAWTRKVESASHDERVVGGGIRSPSPVVIGDSSGSVEGEPQLGGKDAFFYTALSPEEEIDVQQVGTGADEDLVSGFYGAPIVWLAGDGTGDYRVKREDGVNVLQRNSTNSPAGFLIGFTPAGSPMEAYLLNDESDQSIERLQDAMVFDEDLIAAGSTTGVLTDDPGVQSNTREDPAIFRRNRQPRFEEDEDDDQENDDLANKTLIIEPSQAWDQQVMVDDPDTGIAERLVNYRDDEITVLIRRDTASGVIWTLNLFSPEGDPLNSL